MRMRISAKTLLLLCLAVCISLSAGAQLADPVHFTTATRQLFDNRLEVTFRATIDDGWHVYSTDLDGGPTPATFTLEEHEGVALDGNLKAGAGEKQEFDPVFNMPVRYFERSATFTQRLKITAPKYKVKGYLEYGACNDCPPRRWSFPLRARSNSLNRKPPPSPPPCPPPLTARPLPTRLALNP